MGGNSNNFDYFLYQLIIIFNISQDSVYNISNNSYDNTLSNNEKEFNFEEV